MITKFKGKTNADRHDELNKRITAIETQLNLSEAHHKPPPPAELTTSLIVKQKINLSEIEEKFDDMMWEMVEVIGKEGISKYTEIAAVIKKRSLYYSKNKLQSGAKLLAAMRVLKEDRISTPFGAKFHVYSLTDIGNLIFQHRFGKKPVISESALLKSSYISLEHGYGIKGLREVLINSGRYKEVYIHNRNNKMNAGAKYDYIPDIMAIPSDESCTEYFEYERGTITLSDMINRCNKMHKTTTHLNFIIQNKEIATKKILPKINKWLETQGCENLSDTIIRITTPWELMTNNADDNSWLVIYDLNNGIAPVAAKRGYRRDLL